MYEWETDPALTRGFTAGTRVTLNPAWGGYRYLLQEFGNMFPRKVNSCGDGVTEVGTGKGAMRFGTHTLMRTT